MLKRTVAGLALWAAMATCGASGAWAQEQVWIQVELLPTLDRARLSAEGYAEQLPGSEVAGFYMGSGWYTVALGPYSPEEAAAVLANLQAEGVIADDAVILDGANFQQQFWPPAGTGATTEPLQDAALPDPQAGAAPDLSAIPEETYEQAVASEGALSLAEREQLQVALEWAGVYQGGIDGDFGPGTRSAMAAWQAQRGQDATGVLSARQRAELLGEFNAILGTLGMQTVRDEAAGIQIELPMGVLGAPVSEPPFVRYDGREGVPPQVVLISQPGDASRLAGLYEIMQTLEIVPEDGPRERREDAFVIEGQDASIHSTTYAWLVDGQIKGFTLVWPAGDEDRRGRLVEAMRASFRRLPGVLDPAAGDPGEDQAVDLVSGLEVRQPQATASGFFVDGAGHVVTVAEAVAECGEITLDETVPARVVGLDAGSNLALLAPLVELAPRAVAQFRAEAPRIGSEVAVAGFPFGGAISRPALTFGTVADVRGLQGEETVRRLELSAQAGDAGGPVLDETGAVIGMLLPRGEGSRVLPPEVAHALDVEAIRAALAQAGVQVTTSTATGALGAEQLTRSGGNMAVLVSCW